MVNEWVKRSIRLANEEDYIDRLWDVYPLILGGEVPLKPALIAEITAAHGVGKPRSWSAPC